MTAYRDALILNGAADSSRIKLAASLLTELGSVVVIEETVALRRMQDRIICEVIDPSLADSKSPEGNANLVAYAKTLLSKSALNSHLPQVPLDWIVVKDYGTGTVQVWPEHYS